MVDAPCGSFLWMKLVVENITAEIEPSFKYHGIDIVESVIRKSQIKYSADHQN